jgi:integrase
VVPHEGYRLLRDTARFSGIAPGLVCPLHPYEVDRERGRLRSREIDPVVGAPLKALLDVTERRGPVILTNTLGRPWTADGFRSSWGKLSDRAGIGDLTFHDLRGTAGVRLAIAGATVPQIATFTGHSLKDVEAILDAHYLGRDMQLAEAAVLKLEARTKL